MGSSGHNPSAWIELALVPEVSLAAKLIWLREFGSPEAVLGGSANALRKLHPEGRDLSGAADPVQVEGVLSWIGSSGGTCAFLGESGYPARVLELLRPPPLALFMRGDLSVLENRAVVIAGSRNPTSEGMLRARNFALELSQEGVTVLAAISAGIASSALAGAQAAGGRCAGVLGQHAAWHGLRTAENVAVSGLLISEHFPGRTAHKGGYALRHRLLACLPHVFVLVEAAASCDTVALAGMAGDCGVEVGAVPSSPGNEQGRGCNRLLRDGAALVEKSSDVLALLGMT